MKLTAVHVEGCGRFGTPAVLEGLGPGVNILSARNEAGKSTLFRAIRTCLFESHSTTNKHVKELATEGLSLPIKITVCFEHDGKSYALAKSFVKSPSAVLTRDGVEYARAKAADEAVWDILKIRPENKSDPSSYGILWVQQGQSFDEPKPSESAKAMLNDVIAQEVGTLVGGERARALLASVDAELSRYVTTKEKSTRKDGPLHAAENRCVLIATERKDVDERLHVLDAWLDELAEARADLKHAADPAAAHNLKTKLEEAKQALAAATHAEREIRRLEIEERQARELLAALDDQLGQLNERAKRIDENRLRIQMLIAELEPLDEQEREIAVSLGEQRSRKTEFEADIDAVDLEERQLHRLGLAAQKASTRDGLASRLGKLKDFARRLSENAASLRAITVDAAAAKMLETIEVEAKLIRTRHETESAWLKIEVNGLLPVTVNGAAVTGNLARAVTEPLTIEVGADAAITVSPPPSSIATAEAEQQKNRDKLKALLKRHNARDAEELLALRQERHAIEEQDRELRAEGAALGLKDMPPLEAIQQLEGEIAQIEAEAQMLFARTNGSAVPSAAELGVRREALSERRGLLRQESARCQGMIDSRTQALLSLQSKQSKMKGQRDEIDAQLRGHLALLPDEQRRAIVTSCEKRREARASDHGAKGALLAQTRAAAPQAGETEKLRALVERYEAARKNVQDDIEELGRRIARLEGQIETAGGDGLGERAAELKEQEELAQKDRTRLVERVAVLKLLHHTVQMSYSDRREQLNAPLRRHLKPFLDDVFPQAEIELGDDFKILRLKRSAPATEDLFRLSHGTREQIAVLVRLAMGAMICEKGPDVPIILDDALVFSDDHRIGQMFDAINRAGRTQQVIVLTCRERSFQELGGRKVRITGG